MKLYTTPAFVLTALLISLCASPPLYAHGEHEVAAEQIVDDALTAFDDPDPVSVDIRMKDDYEEVGKSVPDLQGNAIDKIIIAVQYNCSLRTLLSVDGHEFERHITLGDATHKISDFPIFQKAIFTHVRCTDLTSTAFVDIAGKEVFYAGTALANISALEKLQRAIALPDGTATIYHGLDSNDFVPIGRLISSWTVSDGDTCDIQFTITDKTLGDVYIKVMAKKSYTIPDSHILARTVADGYDCGDDASMTLK